MKWTKVALVLVIPALALLLLGQSMRSPAAEAKPTALLTITKTSCIVFGSAFDWDDDDDIDPDDGPPMFADCDNLGDNGLIGLVAAKLGGDSTTDPKPEDLAPIDREGGQMHEGDGVMYLVAFVTNDDPVELFADEGKFGNSGVSNTLCAPAADPNADFQDEDCDGDGDKGDGVVAAKLLPSADMDRGPASVRVRQGMVELEDEIIIVGEPWNIELSVTKAAIQTGAPSCILFTTTPTFMAALGAPEKSPMTAKVTDSDGTVVTGALVAWEVDDEYKATTAKPLTPSLESALGTNAPMLLCGTANSGTVTVTAKITTGEVEIPLGLDMQARSGKKSKVEVTVQGMPTDMVLSASPGSLVCDGTATSAVSANLTDADGNPAVDGNPVHFQAKALGSVSPIEPTSAGGAATTTLTPLTSVAGGVTVNAKMTLEPIDWDYLLRHYRELIEPGLLAKLIARDKPVDWRSVAEEDLPMADNVELERTMLVACSEAAPAEVAPPAPAGVPAIAPPATGDGGFLGP